MKAISVGGGALFSSREGSAGGGLAACAGDVAISVSEGRGVGELNI